MGIVTTKTIPAAFTPAYTNRRVINGEIVKGAFDAYDPKRFETFSRATDRAYYEAGVERDDLRQFFTAMDAFDTGWGIAPIGDYNYCNIKTFSGANGRRKRDDTEGSNDVYVNYASHADFVRAKLKLICKPLWGVNLATDSPSLIIEKIEGNPNNCWGTLLSPAATKALTSGVGIDKLAPSTVPGFPGERDIVTRYRALGITDIGRARVKMYCEKLTRIAKMIAPYIAGGDKDVAYTPSWETAPIPPRNQTPIEPPVVPPIRPAAPGVPSVPTQPELKQGPLPLKPEEFDVIAFTRNTRATLIDGETVNVDAVDFELREIRYQKKGSPHWSNLSKIKAIV